MANFKIDIVVDPSKSSPGLKSVSGSLDDIDKKANKLRTSFSNAFSGLSTVSLNTANKYLDLMDKKVNKLRSSFSNAFNNISTVSLNTVNKYLNLLDKKANKLKSSFSGISIGLSTVSLNTVNKYLNLFDKKANKLKSSFSGVFSGLSTVRLNIVNKYLDLINKKANKLRSSFSSILIGLSTVRLDTVNKYLDLLDKKANQLRSSFSNVFNGMGGANLAPVNKSLETVEKKASSVGKMLAGLFAGIGIQRVASEIYQLTDAYTNLQNRIRVVARDNNELNAATEELFKISQRTRSGLTETVEMYSRMSLATRDLGISSAEVARVTETMNKAILLSGATGREANAGIIQLSQGLASGRLQGDEMRSVLEQLPVVADVIAKQMKVTRGELREMGAAGKVTAEVILAGFKNAREEIEKNFKKTIPTISQAFTVLKNSAIKVVGGFNTANGASKGLAATLIVLANNLDTVIRALGAAAFLVGVSLAKKAIPAAIAGIKTLTAAMMANPVGAFLTVLTSIVAVLVAFGDKIRLSASSLGTLADMATAVWNEILIQTKAFVNLFTANFGGVSKTVKKVFSDIDVSLEDMLKFGAYVFDRFVGLIQGFWGAIKIVFDQLPAFLESIAVKSVNSLITIYENAENKVRDIARNISKAFGLDIEIDDANIGKLDEINFDGLKSVGEKIGKTITDGLTTGTTAASDAVAKLVRDANIIANDRAQTEAKTKLLAKLSEEANARVVLNKVFDNLLGSIDKETSLLKMSDSERDIQIQTLKLEKKFKIELTKAQKAMVSERLKEQRSLEIQNKLYNELVSGPINEYKETVNALTDLMRKGKINIDQFNAALKGTEVGGFMDIFKGDLMTDKQFDLTSLKDELTERQNMLKTMRAADAVDEDTYLKLMKAYRERYNAEDKAIREAHQKEVDKFRQSLQPEDEFSIDPLREQLSQRQAAITEFLKQKEITEKEALQMSLEANKRYQEQLLAMERARASATMTSASNMFGNLANISKEFAGEQSSTYKALFAVSKAFSVVSASIKIAEAMSTAMSSSTTVPQMIAQMATVASLGAGIINTIKGAQFSGGFKTGGDFKVEGHGGPDSQLVSFYATPGEQVSIRTPAQTRMQNSNQSIIGAVSRGMQMPSLSGITNGTATTAPAPPRPGSSAAISQGMQLPPGLMQEFSKAQYAGRFQDGGSFNVGGYGGPDSQLVSFRATPGEQVAVRDQGNQTPAMITAPPPQLEQTIVNVIDPNLIESYFESEGSDKVFINKLERNSDSVKNVVKGG
jgi:tape measure domain-containing protein